MSGRRCSVVTTKEYAKICLECTRGVCHGYCEKIAGYRINGNIKEEGNDTSSIKQHGEENQSKLSPAR